MKISMAPDSGRVNRVNKLIINPWTGPTTCCWDTCDKRATVIWSVRMHEHRPDIPCSDVEQAFGLLGRHAHYNFCSEACLMYWVGSSGQHAHETAARNGGRIYGMRPAGINPGLFRAPERRVRATA